MEVEVKVNNDGDVQMVGHAELPVSHLENAINTLTTRHQQCGEYAARAYQDSSLFRTSDCTSPFLMALGAAGTICYTIGLSHV